MALTTFFSDTRLANQLGVLALFIPVCLVIIVYQKNPTLLWVLYWLPHTPTIVITSIAMNVKTMDVVSLGPAWVALVLNIPFYFGLYWYLD